MTETEVINAYITKYALTTGIYKMQVTYYPYENMIVQRGSAGVCDHYFHQNEWYRTWEEAWARAEEMRKKKIDSLRKQIDRLEDMVFFEPSEEKS